MAPEGDDDGSKLAAMSNDTLTLREAATQLGITPATLHRAIRRGRLTATKDETNRRGPVWLVTPDEVEHYRTHHLGRMGWPAKR